MLHILLTILAVIGKILLGLLGFILLILLLVLFVPLRYKGTFQKQDKEMQAKAEVSWLLKFIKVQVGWVEKKLSYEVCILGIPLFRFLKWIKKIKGNKKRKKSSGQESGSTELTTTTNTTTTDEAGTAGTETDTSSESTGSVSEQENPASSEGKLSVAESVHSETAESSVEITEIIDSETEAVDDSVSETTGSESAESEKAQTDAAVTGIAEGEEPVSDEALQGEAGSARKAGKLIDKIRKIPGIPRTIIEKLKGIADKIKGIFSKVESLKDKVKDVLELLQSDLFRGVFQLAKKELLAIIRHILPRKLQGRIEYGTGDPGTTGEILAAIAFLYPVLPDKLVISSDFEEALLNCDLTLKGRIRLIVLVFHGVKVILNKQVRRLIKKVRHKEA